MNRLLKFFYRFQNQRRIHTWASFWTVVKMAWAQSGRTIDSSIICYKDINMCDHSPVSLCIALDSCKENGYTAVIYSCDHEYEYSNGIRKCLKCGKENRYYLRI